MSQTAPSHDTYTPYEFRQRYVRRATAGGPLYFPPRSHVRSGKYMNPTIVGSDRHKFFATSVVPVMTTTAAVLAPDQNATVVNQNQSTSIEMSKTQHIQRQQQQTTILTHATTQSFERTSTLFNTDDNQLTRDAATQSDYRESEAQTDPYTPDYVVADGENPEVLGLAALRWGEGLPAGADEIEMIDRLRRRRAVEAALPVGVEQTEFDGRLDMLAELERKEWAEREDKIRKLQNERLEQIRETLIERERQREELHRQRIEQVHGSRIEKQHHQLEEYFEKRRFKEIRKLSKKHANPENRMLRKDIVEEYAYFGSKTYAPLKRDGLVTDKLTIAYDVRPTLLESVHGIEDIEAHATSKTLTRPPTLNTATLMSIPTLREPLADMTNNVMEGTARANSRASKKSSPRKAKILTDLELANAALKGNKNQMKLSLLETQRQRLQELYRATPRLARPPTPVLHIEYEQHAAAAAAAALLASTTNEDPNVMGEQQQQSQPETPSMDIDLAAIFIQKLLRGRAIQNEFFEGKERSLDLVKELILVQDARKQKSKRRPQTDGKSTPSVKPTDESAGLQQEAANPDEVQMQEGMLSEQEIANAVDSVMESMTGDIVGSALDHLAKELIRQHEKERIDSLVARAELIRKQREEKEKERRELEEAKRAREDFVFNEIIKIHQSTAYHYLNDIFISAVESVSHSHASAEALQQSSAVKAAIAKANAESTNAYENDVREVEDLVSSFLLPQVKREILKKKANNDDAKYIKAAHDVFFGHQSSAIYTQISAAARR